VSFSKHISGQAISCLLFFVSAISYAQESKEPLFTVDGTAIKGYDVVAYFKEGKAVKGSQDFSYTWKEAQWLFSSKEHLDLFISNPEKYEPQYGGYCSWGMKYGVRSKTDPVNGWTIYKDKLYLNYDKRYNERWTQDKDVYINKADKHWKRKVKE